MPLPAQVVLRDRIGIFTQTVVVIKDSTKITINAIHVHIIVFHAALKIVLNVR
jgi:hypothetical protein